MRGLPQDTVPLIDPTKFLKVAHAFGDARTALTANGKGAVKKCVEFFTQGPSLNEVLSIFANFKATATYDPGIGKSMAVTANSGGGMNASVTMGNAFFANDDSVPGTGLSWSFANEMYLVDATQLSPRQNRALTVLHELAHALGLIPSDNLKNDPNGKISEQNNALIYEKCKPLLNSLPLRDNDK